MLRGKAKMRLLNARCTCHHRMYYNQDIATVQMAEKWNVHSFTKRTFRHFPCALFHNPRHKETYVLLESVRLYVSQQRNICLKNIVSELHQMEYERVIFEICNM